MSYEGQEKVKQQWAAQQAQSMAGSLRSGMDAPTQETYVESLRSCASHASETRAQLGRLLEAITGPRPEKDPNGPNPMPPDNLKFALDNYPLEIHRQLELMAETINQIRNELRL